MHWQRTLTALLVALALAGCATGVAAKREPLTRPLRRRTTGSDPSTAVGMVAVAAVCSCCGCWGPRILG